MQTRATPPPVPRQWHVGLLVCWSILGFVGLLVLAGVLFYPVENWRGKRAWEQCKRELGAKGEVLDWDAFIPPSVPDEQNVFKAPRMAEWFVGRGTNEFVRRLDAGNLRKFSERYHTNVIAELTFVSLNENMNFRDEDVVLRYNPPVLSLETDPRSTIIPLVQFEDVPLRIAIDNLARQVDLKYKLDPRVDFKDPDLPEPVISGRWEDVTAPQVLFKLLDKHGLQWLDDPETGIGFITTNPSINPLVHVDIAARERIDSMIWDAVGGGTNDVKGPSAIGCQGVALVTKSLSPSKRNQLVVRAKKPPNLKEIAEFFPESASGTRKVGLRVEPAGDRFHVVLSPPPYTVTEYLAWSDQFLADFELIRDALKRPCARMEGNYRRPFEVPIPNYVAMRSVTRTLSQRAECYLLLNQADKALHELTLIHSLCRLLEGKPTGRPLTMVAVMTEAEVVGLYANTVADGLRQRTWREPQLVAIQAQLQQINLSPLLAQGLRSERAGIIRMLEESQASKPSRDADMKLPQRALKLERFHFRFPRGWFHQNYVNIALMEQRLIDSLSLTNNVILAQRVNQFNEEMEENYSTFRPYTFAASLVIPNFTRAFQTAAQKQTQANQTLIACALERYRLARGEYPESLDALAPQFIEGIPHDLLNGRPLKYRRTEAGQFLLYSVGWNETDEGGIADSVEAGPVNLAKGDWVWPPPSK
jgi:hypothetical protein